MRHRSWFLISVLATYTVLFAAPSRAVGPIHEWSVNFGDADSQYGRSLGVDGLGNVYVTGNFRGSIDLGGGPLASAGDNDIFLAKFAPDGTHLWSKRFGNAGANQAYSVAVNSSGNVLITGYLGGSVDFGGGPLSPPGEIYAAEFDTDGNHVFSSNWGTSGSSQGLAVDLDDAGNMYLTGYLFSGSADFGGGPLNAVLQDAFVVKLDPTGAHVWSRLIGDAGSETQFANGISADASGGVAVTGRTKGTVDFGGGPVTSTSYYNDGFLARYDASGNYQWAKLIGSTDPYAGMNPSSVAFDGADNVTFTGDCGGTFDFGGGPLSGVSQSIFLASFDTAGAHRWSHVFAGSSNNANSVAVNAAGDVVITGAIYYQSDFGGGFIVSPFFDEVLFLAKFDDNGVHQWSYGFDSGLANGQSTALTSTGKVFVTGGLDSPANFGGGTLSPNGQADVLLAKFGEDEPVPVLITRFTAARVDAGVEVEWKLWSDEAIEDFTLYRRGDTNSPFAAIATGAAGTNTYLDRSAGAGRTLQYQLMLQTRDGSQFQSPIASVTTPAFKVALGQNHPNPFRPTTSIEYTVEERAPVVIGVYDASGSLVARLDDGVRTPGTYRVEWNGRDATGRAVSSGVYFYRLEGSRDVRARKMVLLK